MYESSILKFGDWSDFEQKFTQLDYRNIKSEEELCLLMDIDKEFYNKVINRAVYGWKHSPSTSFFNGIAKTKLELPKQGDIIFDSLLDQTRFILLMHENSIANRLMFSSVKDANGDNVIIKGQKALTLKDDLYPKIEEKINKVLQVLYLYRIFTQHRQKQSNFKLPKKLYRGIRTSDLYNHQEISLKIEEVNKSTSFSHWREKRKCITDIIINHIKENGLRSISESRLLSFTSSESIAKYFTKGEGIIVEVSTGNVDIFTSIQHDTRFDQKDFISNKNEKEYILDVSGKVSITDIIINDLDYFIASNNPLAVNLFDHNDKRAKYKIQNVQVEAFYTWISNTKGEIRYRNLSSENEWWDYSSTAFKNEFGVNPRVTEKNVKDIADFQLMIK
jgi:hypothetical protein